MVDPAWPWVALAALGGFHGLNPAMGWLFAVALGLHRGSRAAVVGALVPIALGHLLATAVVAAAVVLAGWFLDRLPILPAAGALLLAWGSWRLAHAGHPRTRVGMRAGFAALAAWSFLMASAHGAGLMLVPAIAPLCLSGDAARALGLAGGAQVALAAVAVHAAAMLAVTAAIALAVHRWFGLAFLRRGWLNLDRLWAVALLLTGGVLLLR